MEITHLTCVKSLNKVINALHSLHTDTSGREAAKRRSGYLRLGLRNLLQSLVYDGDRNEC